MSYIITTRFTNANRFFYKIFLLHHVFFVRIVNTMKYTDAHCHIKPNVFSNPNVVGRICNATQESEWAGFAENSGDETFTSIGVHPWYITSVQNGWQSRMAEILRQNQTVMVGEIGLDKYHADMPTQIQMFIEQMEMAHDFRRPVHLHCVGAWDKMLHILKEHKNALPPAILAHGFSGDQDLIEKLANEYNMFFSYHASDNATDGLVARVLATPNDKLLIESDTFDTDNQIQVLNETTERLSEILCAASDEICEQTNTNFQRITSYVRTID